MSSRILLISALSLGVAGCTDFAETTGTNPDNVRANIGAGLGAIVGGIVASNSDNDSTGKTIVGAGLGAALGGAIGGLLDKQAADLERDLGDTAVTVRNEGDRLLVTLPQDVLFASDSATLRPDLTADIRTLARNLQDYPDTTVEVIGHTDSTASSAYNRDLSARRAASVASVLFDSGVAPSRVRAIGRGEDEPIATNLTPEGKAQNRRVEIVIRPAA